MLLDTSSVTKNKIGGGVTTFYKLGKTCRIWLSLLRLGLLVFTVVVSPPTGARPARMVFAPLIRYVHR